LETHLVYGCPAPGARHLHEPRGGVHLRQGADGGGALHEADGRQPLLTHPARLQRGLDLLPVVAYEVLNVDRIVISPSSLILPACSFGFLPVTELVLRVGCMDS